MVSGPLQLTSFAAWGIGQKAQGARHKVRERESRSQEISKGSRYFHCRLLNTGYWLLKSLRFERVRRRRTIERLEQRTLNEPDETAR